MSVSDIKIMGVLNVTPDSFSDGGKFASHDSAVRQAEKLIADGADVLDIGGESTRPFAEPVSIEEELHRVIPVIESIRRMSDISISIDTSKAEVAEQALSAGASLINDVSALRGDPNMIEVVKSCDVPVIIMHMQGTPSDMQINPSYSDVVAEIIGFFKERVSWFESHDLAPDRLIIDPGIGFGKKLEHNLSILKNLYRFSALGLPLMLAHSRKRFLGDITGIKVEEERDLATAIVTTICSSMNLHMVRVHDVAATRQALQIAAAIEQAV